jgi:hypothetical protein
MLPRPSGPAVSVVLLCFALDDIPAKVSGELDIHNLLPACQICHMQV